MRFSTGVILSMLSANVFAIERLNGAHSGSLLARRAVVADTDAPFLQKRNNGEDQEDQEDQEEQTKSKTSVPNPDSSQKPYVYERIPLISIKATNLAISLKRAPRTSLSMFSLKMMRLRVQEKKSTQALVLAEGNRGLTMLLEALPLKSLVVSRSKKAWGYLGLCKDPKASPFSLKLPFSTSENSKQRYKKVQDDVQIHVKRQILAINTAIVRIAEHPEHEYLIMCHLEGLEMHTKDVEKYKDNLSDRFNKIKKMVEDYRKNSNQRSSSKASSSSLESKKHPEVESKPSENGASSSSQSKSEASSIARSKDGASSSSQSNSEASSSAQSKMGHQVVHNQRMEWCII
ncbi:hypothetical protein BASA62_007997 [Batrachochytrium salamandrivorans]|nr:hypothetical protein BASA62_007997 [Batrachochytrium salamandrivorans]